MAINKPKTLANGSTGNYWKITTAWLDKQTMTTTCTIKLFTDSTYTNKQPLDCKKTYVVPTTKNMIAGDLVKACYTDIKAQASIELKDKKGKDLGPTDPDLAGGTDV